MNETEEKFKSILVRKKELEKITCTCGETVFEDDVILSDLLGSTFCKTYTCTKCKKQWWVRVNP